MKYEKPEFNQLGSAATLVEGTSKAAGNKDNNQLPTANAYEADE
jgi:hypothetical protein